MKGEIEERMAKTLPDIVATVGVLLCKKEGDVGMVIDTIDGTLRAPHMDGGRIYECLGRRRRRKCWK